MAEALAIFGSAASVVSILDVLARAATILLDLRLRWQDANTSLLSFTVQLGGLRAALTKIKDWMENYVDETHHQLVMDLEASLQCCRILAMRVEKELENLLKLPDGKLTRAAKAKWLAKSGGLTEVQQMIDRQTSTLTLLLTACNSVSLAEQQLVLTKPNTRKALEYVRKDSESLIVLRDQDSLFTRYTDNMSALSRVFAFDGDLFASRVYQSVIRDRLKFSIRARQSRSPQKPENAVQVPSIPLRKEERETSIFFLGASSSSKSTLFKQMRHLYGQSPFEKWDKWPLILGNVLRSMFENTIRLFSLEYLVTSDEYYQQAAMLVQSDPNRPKTGMLPSRYLDAFKTLLEDQMFQRMMLRHYNYYQSMADHFFPDLDRLFVPNYSPTFQDILHIRVKTRDFTTTTVNVDSHAFRLFDAGSTSNDRINWMAAGLDIHVIVFLAAMGDYDRTLYEKPSVNSMKESLHLFKNVIKGKWAEKSAIMLCFTKMDLFKKKIISAQRPICDYFPEYAGEQTDVAAAQAFFTKKFKDLDDRKRISSIHYLNAIDTEEVRKLAEELKGIIPGVWRQRDYQTAIATRDFAEVATEYALFSCEYHNRDLLDGQEGYYVYMRERLQVEQDRVAGMVQEEVEGRMPKHERYLFQAEQSLVESKEEQSKALRTWIEREFPEIAAEHAPFIQDAYRNEADPP